MKANAVCLYVSSVIATSLSLVGCGANNLGDQSIAKATSGGVFEEQSIEAIPPTQVAAQYFDSKGIDSDDILEQPSGAARSFSSEFTRKLKCINANSTAKGFNWNSLTLYHLSPSIHDAHPSYPSNPSMTKSSQLVHLGADSASGYMHTLKYIPVADPAVGDTSNTNLTIYKSFFGNFTEDGKNKDYKISSTYSGWPAPVRYDERHYFTPRLYRVGGASTDTNYGEVIYSLHIKFDATVEEIKDQTQISTFTVKNSAGTTVYSAKCGVTD